MEKKTIIDLFESSAKRFPSNPFLWEKTGKRFEPTTYSEVRDLVYEEGAGLISLGVRKGDNMALLSEGRNAWIIGELAMFYAGATNVPLSIKLEEANDLLFRLVHADVKYIMVSGQQLKKIRAIKDKLPAVRKIIVLDEQAEYQDREMSLSEIRRMGKVYLGIHPLEEFLAIGQSLGNDDYATITTFGYRILDSNSDLDENEEENLVFLGMTAMMDPPREESKAAVQSCIEAGIRPVMITGDHKITAAAIAKRIGILQEGDLVCEGADIDGMSDEDLEEYVERVSVYARVAPEHKIRIVKAWQRKGNIVAMTGDGVNDAPALKQADVGVAMGITGTDVAKEAAAIVLADDNFATIIKAVERGRSIFENIRHSIGFLLSGNLGAILTVLYASLAGLPVPFAPVHLLFINLLTDSLPAIALGLEPQDPASMKMKPEKRSNSLLEGENLLKIGVEGLCIGVMTSIAFTIGLGENTTGTGNVILAKTLAFGTLCLGRLVHGYNCKSDHTVIFTKRFWNNPFLTGAFVLGSVMLLAVIYVPGLSGMFQTVSLNPKCLTWMCVLAFANLLMIQLLKWIRSKFLLRISGKIDIIKN